MSDLSKFDIYRPNGFQLLVEASIFIIMAESNGQKLLITRSTVEVSVDVEERELACEVNM